MFAELCLYAEILRLNIMDIQQAAGGSGLRRNRMQAHTNRVNDSPSGKWLNL